MPRATAIESEMFTALIALLATTDRRLVIVLLDLCVIKTTLKNIQIWYKCVISEAT